MEKENQKVSRGRPTVMTQQVIGKLEEGFALGCTDAEACFFAGISVDALYDYQKKKPEFTKRKEALKQNPVLKARKAVVDALENDPYLAFKFLERKMRKEFGPQQKINVSGGLGIMSDVVEMTDEEALAEWERLKSEWRIETKRRECRDAGESSGWQTNQI